MTDIKIGINGFGRIGRLVVRCALEKNVQVVAINGKYDVECDWRVFFLKIRLFLLIIWLICSNMILLMVVTKVKYRIKMEN